MRAINKIEIFLYINSKINAKMRLSMLFCLLSTACCYLQNNIYLKTRINARNKNLPDHCDLTSSYDFFNATRDLIRLEVPNVKNIYWDDGEIVWEFREQDDTNDNTTSVRVSIPPIDPVDASTHLLCI